MPQPSKPASATTFTFGWRSTSRVLVQVEAFTEPRHTEIQAILERMPTPMMEVGGHMRWTARMSAPRPGERIRIQVKPLDPEVGLTKPFLARIDELAHIGMRSMLGLIDQMIAVASDELTTQTVSLMVSQIIADVTHLGRVPKPEGWTLAHCVSFRHDRGSAILLPRGVVPFTGEETEREEADNRVMRFRRRILPGLPAVVAVRKEEAACIDVVIPGIPRTHPLAGWTQIENVIHRGFEENIMLLQAI